MASILPPHAAAGALDRGRPLRTRSLRVGRTTRGRAGGRRARPGANPSTDDAVAAALEATDLVGLAHRSVPSLSGGERARASLARVLAQRVEILLLDEPTASLDLRHQEHVLRIARDCARAGGAVAVVLHDLNAALAYADRVSLLSGGRVVATGAPADVLTADAVAEVYGQAVDVIAHPATGVPLIVPRR